jgi:hypothetical protein
MLAELFAIFTISFLWALLVKVAMDLQYYYSTGPFVG